MTEPIKNFFSGDATKKNIKEEKAKILRLVAEHGTRGTQIYREAQRRAVGQRVADTGQAEKGGISVPQALLDEVNQEQVQQFKAFNDQLDQAAQEQQAHFDNVATSEELFHEGAVGDAANLERLAQERITQFNEQDAAAVRRSRASGSGGSGFSTGFLDAPEPTITVPVDFLQTTPNQDPEGLVPITRRKPATKPTRGTSSRNLPASQSFGRGTNRNRTRTTLAPGATLNAIEEARLADDSGLIIKNKGTSTPCRRRPVSGFLE